MTIKREILKAIESLPDDCDYDDADYCLFVCRSLREALDSKEFIPHEEVVRQMEELRRRPRREIGTDKQEALLLIQELSDDCSFGRIRQELSHHEGLRQAARSYLESLGTD
ncbi:MAG: hypothetical protein WC314_25280 [Vulcanimicrobiota bacterium]